MELKEEKKGNTGVQNANHFSVLGLEYSKTCLKRPPHGARKNGRYRQVVS